MIDKKRFKFGYGDISVGGIPSTRQMFFQQFKPPGKCGDQVVEDKVEWIRDPILIEISPEDYHVLNKLLVRVKLREISEFVFKDYVFDFTNYNEESVNVCKQKLSEAMRMYFFAMAC